MACIKKKIIDFINMLKTTIVTSKISISSRTKKKCVNSMFDI